MPPTMQELTYEIEVELADQPLVRRFPKHRTNTFGAIPGMQVSREMAMSMYMCNFFPSRGTHGKVQTYYNSS